MYKWVKTCYDKVIKTYRKGFYYDFKQRSIDFFTGDSKGL